MAEYPDKEEQYLLRVQNTEVADKLRNLLQVPQDSGGDKAGAPIELRFSSKASRSTLMNFTYSPVTLRYEQSRHGCQREHMQYLFGNFTSIKMGLASQIWYRRLLKYYNFGEARKRRSHSQVACIGC